MDNTKANHAKAVALYLTPEHNCSYLDDAMARGLFVDPESIISPAMFAYMLGIGFRRSGDRVYRPHCKSCKACVPVRVPVDQFAPRRNQRRCWQNNAKDLQVVLRAPNLRDEHYNLYKRYVASRHPDGSMVNLDILDYGEFLTTRWCPTAFVELRYKDRLMAVAVTDLVGNALSAVYTFFDPELADLSPGMTAILWQIYEAKKHGLQYLYLGYWINGCRKMSYKDQYRPIEAWNGKKWQLYRHDETIFT